jgi:hypothetical protein
MRNGVQNRTFEILGLHNITYRTLHMATISVENHTLVENLWTNSRNASFHIDKQQMVQRQAQKV